MWKRWTALSAYFECSHKRKKEKTKRSEKKRNRKSNPKPILLAAVSYEGEYSKLCITDRNSKVKLGCVLLWHFLTRETQQMFDDRWTVFRYTERKSTEKEAGETFPWGDQGCLIRKTEGRIFFFKDPSTVRLTVWSKRKEWCYIDYFPSSWQGQLKLSYSRVIFV